MSLTVVARERADKLVSNLEYHEETIRQGMKDVRDSLQAFSDSGEMGSAAAHSSALMGLVFMAENAAMKTFLAAARELRDGLPSSP